MRLATHVVKRKPPTNKVIESANSHHGTSNAIRPTIATGEVNGIIESQKLIVP